MDVYVGIDCGAANFRLGAITPDAKLLTSTTVTSPLKEEPEMFAQVVLEQINKIWQKDWQLAGLGVGTPGPIDPARGLIYPAANLANKTPIDLLSQLKPLISKFAKRDINIKFDRDTNMAILGESWQGACQSFDQAVMLTIGTGIGGGIRVNGAIYRGAHGRAAELGHMIIDNQAQVVCGLGHKGCLEGLVQNAKGTSEIGFWLGVELANIVNIFDPQIIILGGGRMNQGILEQAREEMERLIAKLFYEGVKVVLPKLGDLSGVWGAAKLAMS